MTTLMRTDQGWQRSACCGNVCTAPVWRRSCAMQPNELCLSSSSLCGQHTVKGWSNYSFQYDSEGSSEYSNTHEYIININVVTFQQFNNSNMIVSQILFAHCTITLEHSAKTAKHIIQLFPLLGSPTVLVFSEKCVNFQTRSPSVEMFTHRE